MVLPSRRIILLKIYVGILTKIRFVDNIDDMEEIQSIFDILKNSKIDITKLNELHKN